jgi:hypothetical protein
MSLIDILQQITASATAPNAQQVDQVTRAASKDELRGGITDALRSDQTPPLPQIVADLFAKATPEQRARILNTVAEAMGPGALAGAAGGVLAGHEGTQTPQVPLDKATRITPDQVRDVVTTAEKAEPSVLDRIGNFYAEHPDLVKTLGTGALMIALARMKNNLGK